MPINLTQEAKAKWAEATETKDPAKKAKLLKEFYSLMKKHKGTEKLEVSIKRQIASLEEEAERARSRKTGSSRLEWVVRKSGIPQISLIGDLKTAPAFFSMLTGMTVNSYEALVQPVVGVFTGASVQFQVILSPLDPMIGEEKQEHIMNPAKSADLLLIVLGEEPDRYAEAVIDWFEEHNVDIRSDRLAAEVRPTHSGGIRVVGVSKKVGESEIRNFLLTYKIRNAIVKVSHEAALDDIETSIFGQRIMKSIFIPLTKQHLKRPTNLAMLEPVQSQDSLALHMLRRLNLLRIYTRSLDGEVKERPLLIEDGSTVEDVARLIHKDMFRFFRYARVWREGDMDGVRVGRSFRLEDGDIIEIHAS
ncbi:MAG: TGS domain-containing protein [Nitrososphaerales archaeon]